LVPPPADQEARAGFVFSRHAGKRAKRQMGHNDAGRSLFPAHEKFFTCTILSQCRKIKRAFSRASRQKRRGRLLLENITEIRGDSSMRCLSIAVLSLSLLLEAAPLRAEEPPKDVKGLFLLTEYPAVSVRPGNTSQINLRQQ